MDERKFEGRTDDCEVAFWCFVGMGIVSVVSGIVGIFQ